MSKTGVELIAEERQEQITKHQRDLNHDVAINDELQLSEAAYGLLAKDFHEYPPDYDELTPYKWDENAYKKLFNKPFKDRLIIAGALIAAEIDRLNHLEK
ncbi:hypothetical protein [Elizabethkingia meningoseptica]|uniref:hypothetical protein n=1 Tax=Elizabethkingia meningoseptica TaxID=238 RepID=UPI0023B01D85|nr:hypothetical protein [Elizabethkingia meningoseptica]MDE5525672.1 hypothetical protein [Elizabethkingia meningoseptica]